MGDAVQNRMIQSKCVKCVNTYKTYPPCSIIICNSNTGEDSLKPPRISDDVVFKMNLSIAASCTHICQAFGEIMLRTNIVKSIGYENTNEKIYPFVMNMALQDHGS